jgi:hypothetical protein
VNDEVSFTELIPASSFKSQDSGIHPQTCAGSRRRTIQGSTDNEPTRPGPTRRVRRVREVYAERRCQEPSRRTGGSVGYVCRVSEQGDDTASPAEDDGAQVSWSGEGATIAAVRQDGADVYSMP